MDEQITNEFIQYKTGFQSGKDEVIELTKLGKIINFNDYEKEHEESWFTYGYNDAINYYLNKVKEGINIIEIKTRDVVKELFTQRVIEYNEKNNKEIPISTFKMSK